jgi:5-methylcytosine-specific restriction protein A
MPATQGHGNPRWTRDETILALDLLVNHYGDRLPDKRHPEIRELSDLLNRLSVHATTLRRDNFRNPDGVAFKLLNLRAASGKQGSGLGHTSRMDRETWQEFRDDPAGLRRLAQAIRDGSNELGTGPDSNSDPDDDDVLPEGTVLTKLHKRRERDRSARKRVLTRVVKKHGSPFCEACRVTPRLRTTDAGLHASEFEVHHLVPLADLAGQPTRVKDLVLLCACCHRLIHALSRRERRSLTLAELQAELP